MFAGWNADYPDAYDFFHILLDGRTIHAANNNNLAYINDAALNKQIDAADALTGRAAREGVRQARHLHDDQAGSVGQRSTTATSVTSSARTSAGTCSSRPTRQWTSARCT